MKIRYNWDYDRYVTEDGKVLRYDSKQDKLVLCKLSTNGHGYLHVRVSKPKRTKILAHRLVFETFIGKVNQGYELDHINTIRDDNRLENLRLVTRKENMNNTLTVQKLKGRTHSKETKNKISESLKGKVLNKDAKKKISESLNGNTYTRGKPHSEFGEKFKEYYGFTNYENPKLYHREYVYYHKHNKVCRWEMDTNE